MSIVFAVVGGGGAVVAIGKSIADTEPYSEHSDYSNYSNYSDYSDAAERRRRRLEAKKAELENRTEEINRYKINKVNAYLSQTRLIDASGVEVSVSDVGSDAERKLNRDEKENATSSCGDIDAEIKTIDALISRIDKVLEEN